MDCGVCRHPLIDKTRDSRDESSIAVFVIAFKGGVHLSVEDGSRMAPIMSFNYCVPVA